MNHLPVKVMELREHLLLKGYMRVSTQEQNLNLQKDALKKSRV